MRKNADINFHVELNDELVPTKIQWSATDSESKEKETEIKAVMISIWDGKKKESLGIDLWIDGTIIGEMNAFFYQVMIRMSETYKNSTNDGEISEMIRKFAEQFADQVEKKAKEKSLK